MASGIYIKTDAGLIPAATAPGPTGPVGPSGVIVLNPTDPDPSPPIQGVLYVRKTT